MNRVAVAIALALARLGYVIAAVLALYMFAPSARADVLSDFLSVYKKIEGVAPAGTMPLSSTDIEASKGLLTCLSKSGKNAALCIDEWHDTPLGQKAGDEIPAAFWQVLDVYIAYIAHDYWGVAYHLGSAATCAVVQVLMGGIDACSLIEELVDLAKDIYAGGKAVAEFFADLGEGAWNVAKGAYCGTLGQVFGGCGDSGPPPKPKVVAIYDTYFKPNLSYGLKAIKSSDSNLKTLVNVMKKQALAKGHAAKDVDIAAGAYYAAVDVLWSAFILNEFMKDVTQSRALYNDAAHINEATAHAWKTYLASKSTLPPKSVPSACDNHFNVFDHDQLTRWIISHAPKALELKLLTPHRWCNEVFWQGNQDQFAVAFRGPQAAGSICPSLGCPTPQALAQCKPFMATVDKTCVMQAGSMHDGSSVKVNDHPVALPMEPAKLPSGSGTHAIAKPALAGTVPPPARAASAAPGQTRPPNWGAIAQSTNGPAATVSPPRSGGVAPALGSTTVARAATTNAAARIEPQLAQVSCTAGAGGLRFNCRTRTGFERCEALRARREVDGCAFNGSR